MLSRTSIAARFPGARDTQREAANFVLVPEQRTPERDLAWDLQRRSRQSAARETKASLMMRQPWPLAHEEEKKEAR